MVDLPTTGSERMRNAKRRATPCLSIAWARMNAPMNVKIVDEPNGPSTSSTGATPRKTATATPSRPPIGIGTASLIHSAMTPSSTAASTCCSRGMSIGRIRKTTVNRGARKRPTVRRPFSNRSSCGESFCSPRLRYVAVPSSALSTSVGLAWFSVVMGGSIHYGCVLHHIRTGRVAYFQRKLNIAADVGNRCVAISSSPPDAHRRTCVFADAGRGVASSCWEPSQSGMFQPIFADPPSNRSRRTRRY